MAHHRPTFAWSALPLVALGGCVIAAIIAASNDTGVNAQRGTTAARWAAGVPGARTAGVEPMAATTWPQPRGATQGPPAWAGARWAAGPAQSWELGQAIQIPELGMEVVAPGAEGVAVYRVYRGSWAERAGLAPGDVLLTFNGQHVTDLASFVDSVRNAPPEQAAPVSIARTGRLLSKRVTVGEGELEGVTVPVDAARPYSQRSTARAPSPAAAVWPTYRGPAPPAPTVIVKRLGMGVVAAADGGVVITGVMGNSHAQAAGLRAGDVIVRFGRSRVGDVEQFQRIVARATPESEVRLKILRNGRARSVSVMVGEGEMEGVTQMQLR